MNIILLSDSVTSCFLVGSAMGNKKFCEQKIWLVEMNTAALSLAHSLTRSASSLHTAVKTLRVQANFQKLNPSISPQRFPALEGCAVIWMKRCSRNKSPVIASLPSCCFTGNSGKKLGTRRQAYEMPSAPQLAQLIRSEVEDSSSSLAVRSSGGGGGVEEQQ